jgi:hypothetical protein
VLWLEYSCAFVDFGQCVYAHWLQVAKLKHICFRFVEVFGSFSRKVAMSSSQSDFATFFLRFCCCLLQSHCSWVMTEVTFWFFFICGSKFRWYRLLWFDLDIINKQLQIVYILRGLCDEAFNILVHIFIHSKSYLLVFTGKQLVKFLPEVTAVCLCMQEILEMLLVSCW